MFEILIISSIVAGIALIVFLAARLDVGSTDAVDRLFVMSPMPARPRGTQEIDLPPFVFRDATSA